MTRIPRGRSVFFLLAMSCAGAALVGCSSDPEGQGPGATYDYDLVITNGRVMDPLTGTDTIAAVGVRDGTIEGITSDAGEADSMAAAARRVIDATGMVVSPGFINTHTHEGDIQESMKVFVRDGITTWIGGNCGSSYHPLADYYGQLEDEGIYNNYASLTGLNTLRELAGVDPFEGANAAQIAQMVDMVTVDMEAGGMGVSHGAYYQPGCTYEEMIATAKEAARHGGMAASHIRDNLFNLKSLIPFLTYYLNKHCLAEAIRTAKEADIPYIVSHLTDITYGPGTTRYALDSILRAMNHEGLRLAVDVIGSDTFPNDFITIARYGTVPVDILMAVADVEPTDFQVLDDVVIDGELYLEAYSFVSTMEQVETVLNAILEERATSPRVMCYIIDPVNTMLALSKSFVFIGNDGSVHLDEESGELEGHPRAAGAFARFLGHWRKEMGMPLMEALFKATGAPAVWLGLEKKGRLQAGCDADIVVFDPDTIIDKATCQPGRMLDPPEGIHYVIVNGVVAVEGTGLTGAKAGEVIRRTWEVPGIHHDFGG